jgi:hypothetical protein
LSLRNLKDLKYDSKIKKSSNQNKIIWDIAKFETGKTTNNDNICTLNIERKLASNHQEIANAFNKHSPSIA